MKSMIVFFAFAMLFVAAHAQLIAAPAWNTLNGAPILTTGLGWSSPLAVPAYAPAHSASWITTDNVALPASSILWKK